MKFKEFLKLSEEQSSTDKGMLGDAGDGTSPTHKPSDGQPFKTYLTSTAGAKGSTGGGGGPGGPKGPMMGSPMMGGGGMFMRKKMKKQ